MESIDARVQPAVSASSNLVLEAQQISRTFGGIHALDEVSVSLQQGVVHAVCGENGAGKSTLMRIIAGADNPDAGVLRINGQAVDVTGSPPGTREGVAMIHQELHLNPQLSVAENIFAGRLPRRAALLVNWPALYRDADTAIERVGGTFGARTKIADLSIGHRQLVEIARALVRETRVLVLDEPTASLSNVETRRLLDIVVTLKRQGVAILYVSHRLDEVFEIADYISVLRNGKLVNTLSRDEATPESVTKLMVGRDVTLGIEAPAPHRERVRLRVTDLTSPGIFRDANLVVHEGEIVGLWGLIGAGRTELARAIYGLDPVSSGAMEIDGQPLRPGRPWISQAMKLAYVPEDRKGLGLLLSEDVKTNLALSNIDLISHAGLLHRSAMNKLARNLVRRLDIRPPGIDRKVTELSGGNQQKVCVARWLARDLAVLILDEPTRGVDVGAKSEIHRIIRRLAEGGLAILLISSEMPEVLGLAHRVLVMREGSITAEFQRGQATEAAILTAATGTASGGVHQAAR